MSSRVAMVVGAGSGLGQAAAVALSAAEVTVVGVDRNEAGLQELPDRIIREVADASDPAVPGPLVDRIAAEVGPPVILINTIGTFELGDALSVTPTVLNELSRVNLGAALWLTQAVAPHMQRKGGGSIVHITAGPVSRPPPAMPPTASPRQRWRTWSARSMSNCVPPASG